MKVKQSGGVVTEKVRWLSWFLPWFAGYLVRVGQKNSLGPSGGGGGRVPKIYGKILQIIIAPLSTECSLYKNFPYIQF